MTVTNKPTRISGRTILVHDLRATVTQWLIVVGLTSARGQRLLLVTPNMVTIAGPLSSTTLVARHILVDLWVQYNQFLMPSNYTMSGAL